MVSRSDGSAALCLPPPLSSSLSPPPPLFFLFLIPCPPPLRHLPYQPAADPCPPKGTCAARAGGRAGAEKMAGRPTGTGKSGSSICGYTQVGTGSNGIVTCVEAPVPLGLARPLPAMAFRV